MAERRKAAPGRRVVARRRRRWAAATATIIITGAALYAWSVQPGYRSSVGLTIADRISADGTPLESAEAQSLVAVLHERVVQANREALGIEGRVPDNRATVGFQVGDVSNAVSETGDSLSSSFTFTVIARHESAVNATRVIRLLTDGYLSAHAAAANAKITPSADLVQARLAVARQSERLALAESELHAFEQENAAALNAGFSQVLQQADEERRSLERQLDELEARRIELDRGLRDMQSGESADPNGVLTSLETRWAIVRGMSGREHPEALQLAAEIEALRAAANRRLQAATSELERARSDFSGLESRYPIDHPDVVRQAHEMSALESNLEDLRVTGLTTGERNYIENLATERRDIDGRIDELRKLLSSMHGDTAEVQARAAQAPMLERKHAELREVVDNARGALETAQQESNELEAEYQLALQQSPGEIRVVDPPRTNREWLTRPEIVVAVGFFGGLIAALVVLGAMSRLDRRICGSATIAQFQGREPLAIVPFITRASAGEGPAGPEPE